MNDIEPGLASRVASELASMPPGGTISADEAAIRQYVTFHIRGELFAVPLAEVQEIIRMPAVVQVPLGPPTVEGLANLRGTVMSITSLRRVFGFDDIVHDDGTRVVVMNRGIPVGFVVDRMAAVVTADEDQIEGLEAIEDTIRSDLLRGVIKASHGKGMTMILDPRRLLPDAVARARREDGSASRDGYPDRITDDTASEEHDQLHLVSFEADGQEYALPIRNVQEIVHVPESFSRLPCAERHVLGIMSLRNRLLPLVSLRDMFGLPPAGIDERSRILVIPLTARTSVGVVIDTVREVLRVDRTLVEPVPDLFSNSGRTEFQSICRLNDGKRLVTVLSAEALFRHEAVRTVVEQIADEQQDQSGMSAQHSIDLQATNDDDEQFVIFRLDNEEYGVTISSVSEIVRVPDELTRIPRTPAFIEGVVNLRGAVLPVIDQRRRFGLADMARNDRQRIMVFTIGGTRTGFIVDSVSEVLRIARSAIGPAPALSAEQTRLIARVANLEKQKRMVLLLNPEELLDRHEVKRLAALAADGTDACA
ncbi:MAG: chemotaxis protein CheW [Rhodopila sp.]